MLYDKVPIKLNQTGMHSGVDYHMKRILLNSSAVTQDHKGLEHGEFNQINFSGEGSTLGQSKNSTGGPMEYTKNLPEIISR